MMPRFMPDVMLTLLKVHEKRLCLFRIEFSFVYVKNNNNNNKKRDSQCLIGQNGFG